MPWFLQLKIKGAYHSDFFECPNFSRADNKAQRPVVFPVEKKKSPIDDVVFRKTCVGHEAGVELKSLPMLTQKVIAGCRRNGLPFFTRGNKPRTAIVLW